MFGHLTGPFGSKCGWEYTHNWIDSCEYALGQGAVIGFAIAVLVGLLLYLSCHEEG